MATEMKPIYTETDHDAAMEEVAVLWRARSGTPKGDRLEVLATLIETYEAKHHAIDPAKADILRPRLPPRRDRLLPTIR